MKFVIRMSCDGYETKEQERSACIAVLEELNSAGVDCRVLDTDIDTLEQQLQESRALLERAEKVIQEAGMHIERPGGGGFPSGYKWLQDYEKLKGRGENG